MINRGNLVSWFSFYLKDSLGAQQPPSLPSLHSRLSLLKKKETNFQESNPGGIPLFCGSAGSFAEKITNISRAVSSSAWSLCLKLKGWNLKGTGIYQVEMI